MHGCQNNGSTDEELSASEMQDLHFSFSWIELLMLSLLQKLS